MPKTIRQSATFPAKPKDVYDALMTSRLHSKITGGKAVISPKIGGKFSAYDGYCTGVNLELRPGRKIVQAWRASDWPTGYHSKVTFAFAPIKGGTRMAFTHAGVPDEQYESIKRGWIDFYWLPMRALFGRRSQR